jgi:hypothetical protein
MSEMSRIPELPHEDGAEVSDVESVVGERDPVRSVDSIALPKLELGVFDVYDWTKFDYDCRTDTITYYEGEEE